MRKTEVRVYTRVIEGHNALHYAYTVSPSTTYMFNNLADVAEPWRAEAERLAKLLAARRESSVVRVELDSAPWYADVLVPVKVTA